MPSEQLDYLRSAPIRRLRHPLDDSPLWGLLGSTLVGLLALLVGLPVLILLAAVLPLVLGVRWLLLLFYWNRRRAQYADGGIESMRGNDCRWLGSAWQCSVLHAVLVFDSHLDLSVLQQLVLSRVVPLYPRLTRRPYKLPLSAGAGHCWLPDSNFDIDRHVFHGSPLIKTEADLQEYVSQLLGEGLTTDKPPWEMHVLQDTGKKTETVAVLRVHQSVADGPALVKMLCRCLADTKVSPHVRRSRSNVTRDGIYTNDLSVMIRRARCKKKKKFRYSGNKSVGFYYDVMRACVVGPLTLFLWLLMSTSDYNLFTQKASWSGQMKVSWSATITLSKVTRVKQVTRSTVNCVLLSALAGALRVLLQSCGVRQPPDLRVVLPVNMRTCDNSKLESRLGNKMAPVVVSLPVGVEGAVPRLWSTRKALRAVQHSPDAVIVYLATAALMTLLPSQSARGILSTITEKKASLQFSSLVGPSSAVLIGGCPLKSVYSMLPAQTGMGLAVSALTYADQVFVAVATDSSLEPAGNMILNNIQSQIDLMYDLLKNRRVPGENKHEASLYRFPDVTRSPVKELACRLTHVQEEVERLSVYPVVTGHETEKLQRLRAEFCHLLRELRKRKSSNELEPWEIQCRTRRRAMSCSFSRRPSLTLVSLLSNNRPASVIETTNHSTRKQHQACSRPLSYIELTRNYHASSSCETTSSINLDFDVYSQETSNILRPNEDMLPSTSSFLALQKSHRSQDYPRISVTRKIIPVNYSKENLQNYSKQPDSLKSCIAFSSNPGNRKKYKHNPHFYENQNATLDETKTIKQQQNPKCSKTDTTNNNNNNRNVGLCDEILTVIKDNEPKDSIYKVNIRQQTDTERNRREASCTADYEDETRDHFINGTETELNRAHRKHVNFRKHKSRTLNELHYCRADKRRHDCKVLTNKDCCCTDAGSNAVCQLNNNSFKSLSAERLRPDYEVAIESLSEFATKIRRLSLENCVVASPPTARNCSPIASPSQQLLRASSRRHSAIPLGLHNATKLSSSTGGASGDDSSSSSSSSSVVYSKSITIPIADCVTYAISESL